MKRLAVALACALLAAPGAAQTFPSRSGESGILDVPDADVVGVGNGALATELKLDGQRSRTSFGPLPVYASAGLSSRLELGLSMRDGGQAGDPTPNRTLFGGALKLRLVDGTRALVSIGVDGYVDRVNYREVGGGRFLLSSSPSPSRPLRLASFVGWEGGASPGLTYGAAVTIAATRRASVVLEALDGPRGANLGGAIRYRAWANIPVSVGFNHFPGDDAWRVSVGIAFSPARRALDLPSEAAAPSPGAASAEAVAAAAVRFPEDRPRFRLKLHGPGETGPRSLRHGPWTPAGPAAVARGAAAPAPALRGSAPSLEDLAEAQLREQETLADSRDRRVRSTAEQLEARDRSAQEEAQRLAERERDLTARDQQLDARERRLGRAGTAPPQQRELEALEAQIAAQERNLAAQERSASAAIDAAQGRERDAAAREDAERVEASRLAASVSGAASRAQQLDVRKQALGARNRQLAALEARLVASGERIDTLERQIRTRASRLDAWQRRLDTRSERLDLVEKRAAEPKAPVLAPPPIASGAAAAPKDKAIFVMVVKSPTAIVKERGAAPAAPAGPGAIQPGTALEKAVAAATVVTFQSPTAQLSELDREAIDNIAKLAAREGCELLIWARAKDPSLMSEAQRRAAEIRSRVMAVAQLADKQVVTRITTRPGAQGVDVVVSALREGARAAPAAAAPPPATRAGQLEGGEAGKRQVREAVQAAQPSIEACVGQLMELKGLPRAEGALKLTVSAAGKIVKVHAAEGDLAGAALTECLSASSGGWTFPPADAEYVVEVPITVIRGGAR